MFRLYWSSTDALLANASKQRCSSLVDGVDLGSELGERFRLLFNSWPPSPMLLCLLGGVLFWISTVGDVTSCEEADAADCKSR